MKFFGPNLHQDRDDKNETEDSATFDYLFSVNAASTPALTHRQMYRIVIR